jgi:predicted alpha/beta hydrolase family esterase
MRAPTALRTAFASAAAPATVLILPGWQNSGPDHWQSRWEALYGYQRVQQHDWMRPLRGDSILGRS